MTAKTIWGEVLDSCPGLLCCVINTKGKLLHATNGYKAVASRLFGHSCEEGRNYPPLITENDKAIHEALTAACLGATNAVEFTEKGNIWEITASPLRLEGHGISGIVLKISSESSSEKNNALPPVVQSNPEILNTVPFRAAITDTKGRFLAVNKNLASCVRADLIGRNIIELVSPEIDSDLTHILMTRSGSVECTMPDIRAASNFSQSDISPCLDEEMNETPPDTEIDNIRHIRIHATPSEWNAEDSVMLTFEDITDSLRTREQLRRLLTLDRSTGILNRMGLEHVMSRKVYEAIHEGGHLSLVMIRVENFRIIHETKGWLSGRRIIRDFVKGTRKFLTERAEGIILGRWSDDEFVLLSDSSGASAAAVANELRGRSKDIVMSAGVADFSEGSYASSGEFIEAAFSALTEAVNSGGNAVVLSHS